jgi:hypothetical protein
MDGKGRAWLKAKGHLVSGGIGSPGVTFTRMSSTAPPRKNSRWRSRGSVVMGSMSLLLGGALVTTTLPGGANLAATKLVGSATVRSAASNFKAGASHSHLTAFSKNHRVHPSPSTTTLPTTLPTTSTTSSTSTTVAQSTSTTAVPTTVVTIPSGSPYPVGVANGSEPSGMAPPSANALTGYRQTYVTDFPGASVPSGWVLYSGTPASDVGGQFGVAHVVVGSGVLSINTWQDPAYNNKWVTGGMSQNIANTYGAYFVRSRLTGAGPTGVELLWPADNSWPPEIDFSETDGGTTGLTATVHWGPAAINHQDQRSFNIDMTQWHTWGVIWTATSIIYTVDGRVWGSVTNTSEIPNIPMTLDLQSQTWCNSGWACPSSPQSMLVDWVAEYTAN